MIFDSISEDAARRQTPFSFEIGTMCDTLASRFAQAFICEMQKNGLMIKPEEKPEAPAYYTREQAADILKVSLPTLHAMINGGLIETVKAGRRTLIEKGKFDADVASGRLGKYYRRSAAR